MLDLDRLLDREAARIASRNMRTPDFVGVLETVLYHDTADRDAVERFYREGSALRVREPGMHARVD